MVPFDLPVGNWLVCDLLTVVDRKSEGSIPSEKSSREGKRSAIELGVAAVCLNNGYVFLGEVWLSIIMYLVLWKSTIVWRGNVAARSLNVLAPFLFVMAVAKLFLSGNRKRTSSLDAIREFFALGPVTLILATSVRCHEGRYN